MNLFFLGIQLNYFPNRRPEPNRKTESLPVTAGFRNAIPTLSYKRNTNGITLFWKKKSPALADSVENYRIIVDRETYGELISPQDESKLQINLLPGKHECYVEIIPKDKNEEIFKTNILKVDIPTTANTLRHERKQQKEPANTPIHSVLEQKDIPIPKLNVQTISASSIRTNWYLDRPIPTDAFVAIYEVHVRGEDFPDQMTSDEKLQKDGYIEHIWHVDNSPLEITGISERQEYIVFIRALFHVQGLSDTKYITTISNEVRTARVDPLIDLLTRPLLKVTRIGLQMATLSWKLDDSTDQSLIKGYRIILNSKPTEILSPNQHEYELRNLKPDTTNEIQVSVTSHPDFVDEKISEPIRILCPKRPQPPTIQTIQAEKPFSIGIKWQIDTNDQDDITSFKIFLDGKLHGEIETNGRQTFKYDFNKLQPDQTYSIYIKALIGQKKLDGYVYQCDIESNASNELLLKCVAPPQGTLPRIERMHTNGIEIVWDAPIEYENVKLTGYQILKNGRAIGKSLPIDKRRASINDLEIGNRYSLQVVPITDQPGGTLFRTGEEYDPNRHGHYLPGPKLDVEYTDLIQLPTKFWIENISGHSAMACWSSLDQSLSSNTQPDSYKLIIWNNKDLTQDKPMIVPLTKEKTNAQLKDLQSDTTYEIQLEAYKRRRHPITNDPYIVSTTSEILNFQTGSPPDAPSNIYIIACTNTDVRIGFDSFIEHNAEIITIRVQCQSISTQINTKDIILDLTPDSIEFILSNLIERTDYTVTIYGITDEYLNENHYRDISQLPKSLKPSNWLPNKSLQFQTSGCQPASNINIQQATIESIKLQWILPKAYGSTQFLYQILRWKLEQGGEEHSIELDQNITDATIPGILPSGSYKISLDSLFSVKINLEDDNNNETSRKEIRLTTNETILIRFHPPAACERPEIYLTGYTINTIDLQWNKPNMFNIIDHPEKMNEQLKIHRRLLGYRVDINGRKHNTLDKDQYRCTLTECQPGEEYKVQLVAQTVLQNEYMNDTVIDDKENTEEPTETPSKKLTVRMLQNQDLLRSFQANFEFNHNETNETNSLGKININWKVSNTKNISHFILQWRSSKDLRMQQKVVASNETSSTIDSCDEKHHYVIEIIIVTNDGNRQQYEQLTIPIPGAPDAPKLWLVKTSDTSFIVEWSEPKTYGIPIIGFQLYIEGKKAGDTIEVNLRRAEIPSRINRTYQVNVCSITNNPQCLYSIKSQTLSVITTPTTNLNSTMYYNNDDGNSTTFDRNIARIIPVQIESINEEKLHIDWTSFLPTTAIRAYYIHYTCLNNGEVQAMKVSKRFRHAVLRDLRPGFTYGIMVLAVDKNGGVLYTSDKNTIQMNAPPNSPIVAISERTNDHVKLEWRPAASYGEITVVGYKIFVNNRLAAVLSHDQLTYTLTNGIPCDIYTVHVQALSNDKTIVSPMSRDVQFSWPGIKAGAFKRIDDGQTGTIILNWEHPQLEDEMEKLIGFKLFSENLATHAVRLHGEYDISTHQATIHDLNNGKYRLWLEIQSENYCVRARPIIVTSGRFNSLANRQITFDSTKFFIKKQKRFRSPTRNIGTSPPLRHIQYS